MIDRESAGVSEAVHRRGTGLPHDSKGLRTVVVASLGAVIAGACVWMAVWLPDSGATRANEGPAWLRSVVPALGAAAGVGLGLFVMLSRIRRRQEDMRRELRTAEAMLMSAQKLEAFGVLAASMAHDFNNTLTVIRGMSDLARLEAYDPRVSKSALDAIHLATYRAEEVANRMIELLGQQRDRFALRDLNTVTREFSPILRQAAGSDAIVAYDLADGLPATQLNRGVIEQALLNLVINARDATEGVDLPRITISTKTVELIEQCTAVCPEPMSGTFVEISVTDNGCGIAEKDIPRAFTPFFTTKEHGTGLGLPSVLRSVQLHEGMVDVRSRPGSGTCVRMLIPLRSTERTDAHEAASPVKPSLV